MSHRHDIYCVLIHHTPSSIMLTKLYFLRNVMMMIICSLVKIITTHTHTRIQFFFLLRQTVATFATHRDSYIQIFRLAHVSLYTHILNIT